MKIRFIPVFALTLPAEAVSIGPRADSGNLLRIEEGKQLTLTAALPEL